MFVDDPEVKNDIDRLLKLPYFLPNEVVVHNQPNDCWMSYLGMVFDLTDFCNSWKSSPKIEPILKNAGKDISHWFDHLRGDITHQVHNGKLLPHCPHGLLPDSNKVDSLPQLPLPRCPWWLDDQFHIGWLTKNARPIRIINVLTSQEAVISVCEEDTIERIQERYLQFNSNAHSYVWKSSEQPLDMRRTLTENGILDERDRYMNCGLPDDLYIPSLLCYYKDDLSEA